MKKRILVFNPRLLRECEHAKGLASSISEDIWKEKAHWLVAKRETSAAPPIGAEILVEANGLLAKLIVKKYVLEEDDTEIIVCELPKETANNPVKAAALKILLKESKVWRLGKEKLA